MACSIEPGDGGEQCAATRNIISLISVRKATSQREGFQYAQVFQLAVSMLVCAYVPGGTTNHNLFLAGSFRQRVGDTCANETFRLPASPVLLLADPLRRIRHRHHQLLHLHQFRPQTHSQMNMMASIQMSGPPGP